MAVPQELATAVAEACDRELGEPDVCRRAQLLARTRRTLDAWMRHSVTTAEAVAALADGPPY